MSELSKRKRRRKVRKIRAVLAVTVLTAGILLSAGIFKHLSASSDVEIKESPVENHQVLETTEKETALQIPSWIDKQIIKKDGKSRRGIKLKEVKDVVIHYVGNPGTTAQQNHDFYAGDDSDVSSHFIVGLDGEIIQCIPLDEHSEASNWRNRDSISIEVCHRDETGEFSKKTYKSLVKLVAWLESVYGLDEEHVIRHYDITEKECPKYFVDHEDEWELFKEKVRDYRIKKYIGNK